VPYPVRADDASKSKEISEVEKQIQELNKKLAELKKKEQEEGKGIPDDWFKHLHWRPVGPATMSGRIVAFSAYEADPCIYWVATASGGLLKTINNGTTFEHQFDKESTVSIGDVCVAPSDPKIVWVGTGEHNPRNSVSYGDGVYKSTDGGQTWKNMGLKSTFQIGRIVVHPKNPDVVYVGALGRLYGPNPDRGLFKTSDGGKTWDKIFYVDDKTGVIDMQMNPTDPETLLVAMWERQRDGFDSYRGDPPMTEGYDAYDPIKKWGPGSGLYKTNDGGKSFRKLTNGLPTGSLGRIGISYYRKNPNTIFTIIDGEKIGMGAPPNPMFLSIEGENGDNGAKLTKVIPHGVADKVGLKFGDVIKEIDKKSIKKYDELAKHIPPNKPGEKMTLTVQRDKQTIEIVVPFEKRSEPVPTPTGGFMGVQGEDVPGGVRIAAVVAEAPASKVGLQIGDVIRALDKIDLANTKQLSGELAKRKLDEKITFKIQRGEEIKEVVVTLQAHPKPELPNIPKRPYSAWYGGQQENIQTQQGSDGPDYCGVYKSTDGGESWTRINSCNPRPMYFSQIRVDPTDENYIYVLGVLLYRSKDGGKTFSADGGNGVHPDQHALWIDPRDGRHMIVGCDGGFYATYDRMVHWDHLNHLAIGQFYHVCVDSRQPYRIYGGLQDNGSWGGPNRSLSNAGPMNEDWIVVSGGDGFVCRVDPKDPDLVYFESQDGGMGRRNLRTGEFAGIGPPPVKGQSYRFNWNTPFILSAHNPGVYYCAGNYVFRSVEHGDHLKVISPEITRTKRGTATALAESPRNSDVLFVGTDDGNLWISKDAGVAWTNIIDKVGLPSGPRWVASIEPSRFVDGRAYVAFDAHRSDDDQPYLYVTEDFGQTWKSLRGNLPAGSSRVLREDIVNPDLLFVGTEFGAWCSLDRGQSWVNINKNLPTVAVHDFALPTTANDLVAATHGRSIWVLDIANLRQMTPAFVKTQALLFKPSDVIRWRSEPSHGSPYGHGSRHFVGANPPYGAQIYYALRKKADNISLQILDYTGKKIQEFGPPKDPGLHHITWDLISHTEAAANPMLRRGRITLMPLFIGSPLQAIAPLAILSQPRTRQGRGREEGVPPGMYHLLLTVNGEEYSQGLRVEADPTVPGARPAPPPLEETIEEREREEERESRLKRDR
jgi:photosystem II stability/assembly factor-like uncharacterized protein